MPRTKREAYLRRQQNDSGMTFEFHDSNTRDALIKDRRPEVDIGDSRVNTFEPTIYLSAWDDECFLKIHLPSQTKEQVLDDGATRTGKIEFETDMGLQRFRVVPDKDDDDSFEWEIIFDSIPQSNVLVFPIEHQGVDFHYQTALTQEEIDEGCHRPDNIIDSWAVYHKTKRNNVNKADGSKENYGNGKLCHINRLKLIDANGREAWVKMNIDSVTNLMTVTMPKRFLNNASYPVTLDPDIGFTTFGGAQISPVDYEQYSNWANSVHSATADGDLTDIYVALLLSTGSSGGEEISAAIYEKDATLGTSDKVNDVNWSLTATGTLSWHTLAITGSILNGSDYVSAFASLQPTAGDMRIAYDNVGSWGDAVRNTSPTDFTWPSTLSGFANHNGREWSVYASYDEASGGSTGTLNTISMVVDTTAAIAESGSLEATINIISSIFDTTAAIAESGSLSASIGTIDMVLDTTGVTALLGSIVASLGTIGIVVDTTDASAISGSITATGDTISIVVDTTGMTATVSAAGSSVGTLNTISMVLDTTGQTAISGSLSATIGTISLVVDTTDAVSISGSVAAALGVISTVLGTSGATAISGSVVGSIGVISIVLEVVVVGDKIIYGMVIDNVLVETASIDNVVIETASIDNINIFGGIDG